MISSGVFYGCDYLNNFEVEADNPYYVSVEGALFSKDMKKLVACPSLFRNSYTIPEGVEEIVDFAFADCYMEKISGSQVIGYGLTKIEFSESLKVIGDGAFLNCKRLSDIMLPNGLEVIGSLAFGNGAFFSYDVGQLTVSEKNHFFTTNGKQLFNKNGTVKIEIFR